MDAHGMHALRQKVPVGDTSVERRNHVERRGVLGRSQMLVDDADQTPSRVAAKLHVVDEHAENAEARLAERSRIHDMDVRGSLRVRAGNEVNGHLLDVRVAETGARGKAGVVGVKVPRRDKIHAGNAKSCHVHGKAHESRFAPHVLGNEKARRQRAPCGNARRPAVCAKALCAPGKCPYQA